MHLTITLVGAVVRAVLDGVRAYCVGALKNVENIEIAKTCVAASCMLGHLGLDHGAAHRRSTRTSWARGSAIRKPREDGWFKIIYFILSGFGSSNGAIYCFKSPGIAGGVGCTKTVDLIRCSKKV